ncbi:MAG: C40 family peptidase [Lachnospiraceae bacterium]|nr:C40 family peptidase [Lachnospiraceae bacterium]
MEAVAAKEETVIASVAAASGEALSSGTVTAAQDEKGTESSSKEAASEETPAAGAEETAGENTEDNGATVSGNNAGSAGANETENTEKKTEIEGKVIESTQSIAELLAGQAATMTEEEKEFSNLVIAKVNNYVNVRSDASEESEVVGKLYDKSVGTFISEKNGWYEINSGNVTGYVKAEFCVTGKDAIELAKQVGTRIATVTTTTLKVREEASAESTVLGLVPIEEELSVVEEEEGWIKVDIEEGYGWVSTDFVSMRTDFVKAESKEEEEARLAKEEEERRKAQAAASANSEKPKSNDNKNYNSASSYIPAGGGSASGNAVAEFALQFKGNPYVWGGTSLTNGADCSGFVMSVYKNFGVSLPHSSTADRNVGSAVGSLAEAQPGDLICYSGHVGIYIGGNQIVHASTSKTGIIVSNASYRNILAIRRIF